MPKEMQNGLGTRPAVSLNHTILAVILLTAGLLFPLQFTSNAYLLNVATMALIFAITGSSWNLLGGYAGQPSFGHAAFFGVGAYTFAVLFPNGGLGTLPGFLIAGIAASIVALPIGLLIFRLRGPYFALSMLAFAEILRLVAQNWTSVTMGASGFLLSPTLDGKITHYYLAFGALVVLLTITAYMAVSRSGFYLLAIREDEDVANALGVNIVSFKMLALAISAFFTGFAGAIYANYFAYIEPNVVFSVVEISLATYLIAVLGGQGTVLGPLIGSIVLTSSGEVLRVYTGTGNILIYGIFIVLVVLFMPDGVMGMLSSRTRRQPER
ncbi:MAG: branched-chain amino acid ABC transporter permease [Pseudolabrys sp.]|nr:branched-chain amino acid ABC transporter permease [Pseudolabrys sp.]